MLRRAFLASCAAGPVAIGVANAQRSGTVGAAARAIAALNQLRQLEVAGAFDKLATVYQSDAMTVDPGILEALVGRAAVVNAARTNASQRKLLYYYYRQPQVVVVGTSALVISNYEAGYEAGGQTVEETGKSSSVVMLGPNPPLVALDVNVPNYYGGSSYGPLGTPLVPHFGVFPVRALGPALNATATGAGGGENDVLFAAVKQINASWVAGNADDLLSLANPSGVFLIGDYSPFYITGTEQIKQHFVDFYKTSKVNSLHELNPVVRIWGDSAAVAFNFNLDYTIGGRKGQSPGRGVYTFARGAANTKAAAIRSWRMAACAASHLVLRNIGDPYPSAA
jgi:hypothetical protein